MHDTEAKATMRDIARLTGLSVDKVRRHHRDGWFDMRDFSSVVRYTRAQMDLGDLQPIDPRR